MNVLKYSPEHADDWNAFLATSRNGTFLFDRRFLQYHEDRFLDYSLIVKDADGRIVALLPANLTSSELLTSHAGLTYGGFIIGHQIKLLTFLRIYSAVLEYLQQHDIKELKIKMLPAFYDIAHSTELEYALFISEAQLYRRDIAFAIDQQARIPYSGNIRREGNKAEKAGATLAADELPDEFWKEILEPNLQFRYQTKPVHSLSEIKLLQARFPDNIKQCNVYLKGNLMAGATMFLTTKVAHCQYISATDEGRANGCLNFLFKELIDNHLKSYRYFDFGIVNEREGRDINQGMLFWKESFGGRAQKHDFYAIDTSSYTKLSHLIV